MKRKSIWRLFSEDFKAMGTDLKEFFKPPKITTADEFIEEFEKVQLAHRNSKDEALKRLGLDKIPCRLTSNDFNCRNDPQKTETKYERFRQYLDERDRFEKGWKND